MRESNLL